VLVIKLGLRTRGPTLKCSVVVLSTLEEDCKGEEASSFKVELKISI
jgi:hypothetical protein